MHIWETEQEHVKEKTIENDRTNEEKENEEKKSSYFSALELQEPTRNKKRKTFAATRKKKKNPSFGYSKCIVFMKMQTQLAKKKKENILTLFSALVTIRYTIIYVNAQKLSTDREREREKNFSCKGNKKETHRQSTWRDGCNERLYIYTFLLVVVLVNHPNNEIYPWKKLN